MAAVAAAAAVSVALAGCGQQPPHACPMVVPNTQGPAQLTVDLSAYLSAHPAAVGDRMAVCQADSAAALCAPPPAGSASLRVADRVAAGTGTRTYVRVVVFAADGSPLVDGFSTTDRHPIEEGGSGCPVFHLPADRVAVHADGTVHPS